LNSYIDSALNIGLGGPLILLVTVVAVGRSLLKSIDGSDLSRVDSRLALETFLAFVIIFVSSFESGNLVTHPPLAFLTVLGAAEVLRLERRSVRLMSRESSFLAAGWNTSATSTPPLTSLD
jgi:hypothetical protein